MTPVAAAALKGSPPDRRQAWTAEIEWREIDGESRFHVIARGAGTVVVAQSAPLEWPPSGPAAVKAVRNAADKLADMLVAAGWKTLPPGHAWYAKRFAWEPAKAAGPARPGAAGRKPIASPRPGTSPPAPGGAGSPVDRVRGMRRRWKLLALLCVLGVLALLALQIGGGSDGSPSGRTPAGQAAEPKAKASEGTDLSVPLLVLLGVPVVVVIIRQTRRALAERRALDS